MKSQGELRAEIAAAEAEKRWTQTQPLAVCSQSIAEVQVCDTNISKQPTALQLSMEQDKPQSSHRPEKQGLDPNGSPTTQSPTKT